VDGMKLSPNQSPYMNKSDTLKQCKRNCWSIKNCIFKFVRSNNNFRCHGWWVQWLDEAPEVTISDDEVGNGASNVENLVTDSNGEMADSITNGSNHQHSTCSFFSIGALFAWQHFLIFFSNNKYWIV
jgi:hypothetical protein